MSPYQRILVPIDGSTPSNAGLAEAMKLARLTGAQLRLLHVMDDLPIALVASGVAAMSPEKLEGLRDAGAKVLREALELAQGSGIALDTVLFDNQSAPLSERVREQAASWPADLIVMGTHGRKGIRRAVLGSDAERIVCASPVPVLLVRADDAA